MFFTAPGKRRFCSRRTYQSCPSSQPGIRVFSFAADGWFFWTIYDDYIYIYVYGVDESRCALYAILIDCTVSVVAFRTRWKSLDHVAAYQLNLFQAMFLVFLRLLRADCSRCALAQNRYASSMQASGCLAHSCTDELAAAKVGSRWDCCCMCCMPTIQSRDSRNASSQPFSAVGGSWRRNSGFIAGYVCKFDRLEVADKLLWFNCNKFVSKRIEE